METWAYFWTFYSVPFIDLCVCSYASTTMFLLQCPYQVLWSLLLCSSFSKLLQLFRVIYLIITRWFWFPFLDDYYQHSLRNRRDNYISRGNENNLDEELRLVSFLNDLSHSKIYKQKVRTPWLFAVTSALGILSLNAHKMVKVTWCISLLGLP